MILDDAHTAHLNALLSHHAAITPQGLMLGDQYVMFFAEGALMRQHAEHLVEGVATPDVLEIGLGLGVFAEQLATLGIGSYTAVEPHPEVARLAHERVLRNLSELVDVIVQPWQLTCFPAESFDAIMYDTWPPDGHADNDFATFVETVAIPCLRPGGRFSFFSSGSRLSPDRQRTLERHFEDCAVWPFKFADEDVPPAWTKPTTDFVIPIAVKGGSIR